MSHPANDIVRDGILDYAKDHGLTVDEAAKLYEHALLEAADQDQVLTTYDDYSDLN